MSFEQGRTKTGGRQKGQTNKCTKELKDMILGALADVGGQTYLAEQAISNPSAFLTLVGKILPKDIKANIDRKITLEQIITGMYGKT